jgi:hypothetical protein
MTVFSSYRKARFCKRSITSLSDVTNQMRNTVTHNLNQILSSQFTSSLH